LPTRGREFDPDEAGRLFERFFRGARSRESAPGTGLGLAVVEALAHRWGGKVAISNRPQGGARAEVRLPAAAGGGPLLTHDPGLGEALPGRG